MKTLQVTKQFKKDVKRLKNQGKDFTKLKVILETICEGKKLKIKFQSSGHLPNWDASYAALNISCSLVPGYKNFFLFTVLQSFSNDLFSRLVDIV